jgi:hypothetical protein
VTAHPRPVAAPPGPTSDGSGSSGRRRRPASEGLRVAEEADVAFTDISGTHAANIRKLVGLGVTVGVSDTEYAPAVKVERSQMASFLARRLNRLGVEGHSAS